MYAADGQVLTGGTVAFLARIVDFANALLTPSGVSSVTYTIYLLDARMQNPTPVTGHANVALTPSSVIFATLQTDARWLADDEGYNFAHTIDVSTHQAFAQQGAKYQVEYLVQIAGGQPVIFRYLLAAA